MANTVEIDKAGRIVIPKKLREKIHISPGDKFQITILGSNIQLEPLTNETGLTTEGSLLVFRGSGGQVITQRDTDEALDQVRGRFTQETSRSLKKK